MVLTIYDLELLRNLNEDGGFATGRVAELAWSRSRQHLNKHIRSAWARVSLLRLEAEGLVRRMDNEKPVAWQRTQEGTAAAMVVAP